MNDKSMFLQPTEEAQVADIRNMDPLEAIKAAAEGIGLVLNDPKPNCKHCHGLGYVGRYAETGEPIACKCLFPKYESEREIGDNVILPQNRAQRRAMQKKNRG